MKIVIYARFSSHAQNEQSIEGQLRACYEFAKRNDFKVVGEYIDKAISGTGADNRPDFQRMVADSAKRQFQGVLVYQLDRFARNRYDSAIYKAKLKKNGVKVLSARENISDDASGILIEGVLESMAEYYSVELGQKVKRGMLLNAEKCKAIGSVPLGYDVDEEKHIILNEESAVIVQRIFQMYLSGKTMAEIIRYLNEHQVKTSVGNEYNKNSIRRILTNKRYRGIYTFKDIEIPGGIPQIIDDDTWSAVQILMQKNKKAPARAKSVEENYLLKTRIFCGFCESAMIGVCGTSKTGKIYQYYQCNNKNKCDCERKRFSKKYIEDKVIDETISRLTPEYIDMLANAIEAKCKKDRNAAEITRIEKMIRENDKATANLITALEQGKAVDVISSQIEKRQQEKAELEVLLARERIQAPMLKYEQIVFFLERLSDGDVNDQSYRQSVVDTFISGIEVYDDCLVIYYNACERQTLVPLGELKGSSKGQVVGVVGLEPTASCSQSTHATNCATPRFYCRNLNEC